jgi:hypothetical protein
MCEFNTCACPAFVCLGASIVCRACGHGAVWHKRAPVQPATPSPVRYMRRRVEDLENRLHCSVCMERLCDTMLRPCGHATFCNVCAQRFKCCPLCRAELMERIVFVPL